MMTGSDAEVGGEEVSGQRRRHPTRGKRYAPALKKEILEYALGNGVESAAGKFGVTETTIYDWRRAGRRRGNETGNLQPVERIASGPAITRHVLWNMPFNLDNLQN
jgi:transposase-like protein